jgi:hypothetical protein
LGKYLIRKAKEVFYEMTQKSVVADRKSGKTHYSGAEFLLEALKKENVDVIFGYPGGSVLPIYDKLYSSELFHILTRHEQGAIHAAEGYARITGKPGVVFAAAVLLGLLGVGVGAILRNQVLGIVVTLGWFFLLEPIIGSASSAVGKWFPGSASSALAAFPGDDQLSVGAAAAVLASAALLLLMLGTAKLRSADVAA